MHKNNTIVFMANRKKKKSEMDYSHDAPYYTHTRQRSESRSATFRCLQQSIIGAK
jgi:hypothetical protein